VPAVPKGVLTLATIGYERATLPDVIGRLRQANIEIVIDVRAVASSRRAGFSKTLLAASLHEAGIDYRHLRALGTPKPGRQAARAGRIHDMHRIFEAHLESLEAQMALAEATEIAGQRPSALLCFEADAAGCHRRIVANRIRTAISCDVIDL
jgi:uncharacterized protein (DUF488 family)